MMIDGDDNETPDEFRNRLDAMNPDEVFRSCGLKIMSPDKKPVSCSAEVFNAFIKGGGHVIRQDTIGWFWISTVFLTVDHGFFGESMHFESMVFDRRERKRFGNDQISHGQELNQVRYHNHGLAQAGHCTLLKTYRKKWNQRLGKLYGT